MNNKKIIAKGLIVSILLFYAPMDSIADEIEDYKLTVADEKQHNNKFEEFFNNLFDKFKKPKEVIKVNKNINIGTVKRITLSDGQFIPNLNGNPDGYEKIEVTTVGDKKLVKDDYENLRTSGIPKIDLSNASSDEIPEGAFTKVITLTEFKFPKGIKKIGYISFWGCKGLKGDLIIPNSVVTIENNAFTECTGLDGILEIPNSVKTIGNNAFERCSGLIGDLEIPNSVTNIGYAAFWGCTGFNGNLIIPNSVQIIGDNAFTDCKGLTGDLILPDSITKIGSSVFYGCSGFNGNLIIPNSVVSIGDNTFWGCNKLKGTLVIPNSVKTIGISAFYGCSGFNGDLIFPNSVVSIGDNAFWGCIGFNGRLILSNSITSIGNNAFTDCKNFIGDIIIPNSVKSIGYSAFWGCSGFNGELLIPNSVVSIGNNAFYKCSKIKGNVIIPDSVTSLGTDVFKECNSLNKIFIKVNYSDFETNYRKNVIDKLPNNPKTIIDLPYNFDISDTWLFNTKKTIGKPTLKSVLNGIESELVNNSGEIVSLYIPSLYKVKNISVFKDGVEFKLPHKNSDNKHIFNKPGIYEVTILTDLGNTSILNFKVEDVKLKEAEEAVKKAEETKNPEDIENARDLVNKLPESIKKDDLQDRLDSISPNLNFETKNSTSNFDLYIKYENMIGLSLNTNSIIFEDFSGVEDMEKLEAIVITVDSSLPYELNAYLPHSIQNSDSSSVMENNILNIRESNESIYKTFVNNIDKLVLKDSVDGGDNVIHKIDLKLKGNISHKKDFYKTVIKFEIQQK